MAGGVALIGTRYSGVFADGRISDPYRILVVFNIISLRKYLLICLFYRDYVYFQNNSWNFENKFTLAGIDILTLLKTYVTSNNLIK